MALSKRHHDLKSDVLVGERLRYVAEIDGPWLALLNWSAAAASPLTATAETHCCFRARSVI